jgi:hypothetical protein
MDHLSNWIFRDDQGREHDHRLGTLCNPCSDDADADDAAEED